ncbi:hypothetical protein ACFO3K_01910 [Cellulomonas algicola]|uniref:hypothetical protein n=1 Tax=Cellulomonas algicola TaxID=2071633 RepID=UPI001C3FE6B7|nr:hypothetical protein [Cellulomonas algicola]
MLQTAAGRYFRPGVPIGEILHRRTLYTNAWLVDTASIELPVGTLIVGTERDDISTVTVEAIDRLERTRPDGSNEFMIATGGDELIDDIAYVLTFVLNVTRSRDIDLVRKLVPAKDSGGRDRTGAALFPQLFDPGQVVHIEAISDAEEFMSALLELSRQNFARVMRVVRASVDATRRAIDDPTGAYTDFVAALESLADDDSTTPTSWDRYDGRKRKIIDAALDSLESAQRDEVRAAILHADRAGLKRRFVSSTLARVARGYYREEALGAHLPPQSADLERMLGIAYDIRSRRSHVLQDLGRETWVFSHGAEVAYEPRFDRIFTLAGLWRLLRHVVRQYVADAEKVAPEPWDYRLSLPGIVTARLAPQYWVGSDFDASHALGRLNGVADALIAWLENKRSSDSGFNLAEMAAKIERLVPTMPHSDERTALVAIHRLSHEWTDPSAHRPEARAFVEAYEPCLREPTPISFTVRVLSNFVPREWTLQEWFELATERRAVRVRGKGAPLPAKIDALLQLQAAEELEAAGSHDDALIFASNAVEECPGNDLLLRWEASLAAGDHDMSFHVHQFLFGRDAADEAGEEERERERPSRDSILGSAEAAE